MSGDLNVLITALEQNSLCPSQVQALRSLQQQVVQGELIVSVIGQFKRGKSSLINSILGEEILPIGIVPLTSVATEIRYGSIDQAQVCFADKTENIGLEDLPLYCSEEFNASNHKEVKVVRVQTPQYPFGEGIVFVDTPGVGSINQSNTQETVEHLIHSDAIVFVLSVDSPLSQTELDFLIESKAYASKFYFVVNKIDCVSERDLKSFCNYCQGIIEDNLGCEIVLHPVSALTKKGISELVDTLNDSLHFSHGQLLQESIGRKVNILIEQVRAIVELEEKSAATPAEELVQKLEKIEMQKKELLASSDQLEVLAGHHTEKLVCEVRDKLLPSVECMKKELFCKCTSLGEDIESQTLADFKSEYQIKLNKYLKNELDQLNETGLSLLSDGYAGIVSFLEKQTIKSEECLSEFMLNEFGITYPIAQNRFEVSQQSDFVLHVGMRGVPKFEDEFMDHMLPKNKAKKRFLAEALRQAEDDIDCNFNNMIYNYRYKMQESLRPLCRKMTDRMLSVVNELDEVKDVLQKSLKSVQAQESEVDMSLQSVKEALEKFQM